MKLGFSNVKTLEMYHAKLDADANIMTRILKINFGK